MYRDTPREKPTRLGKCLRKSFRISFSNFGMLIIVFVYLIFGGFLFQFIENKKKVDNRAFFRRHRDECIQELWTITKSAHVLYKQNWTVEALDPLRKFEATVIKEMNLNHKFFVRTWSFKDSLFYSVTILTTIGYNSHTPNTSIGKIATIVYATFGIPLMLLCICNVGFMLSDLLQYGQLHKNSLQYNKKSDDSSEKSICEGPTIVKLDTVVKVTDNSKNKKSCSNDVRHVILDKSRRNSLSEKNLTRYGTIKLHDGCSLCQQCNDFDINCDWCKQEINFKIGDLNSMKPQSTGTMRQQFKKPHRNFCFPITIALFLFITYVCAGAFTYSIWKDKPFADGAYFCFLTLTTIGSCDTFRNVFNATNETVELLFYSAYLVTGLILISTFILLVQRNVLKLEFMSTVTKFQKRDDEVAL